LYLSVSLGIGSSYAYKTIGYGVGLKKFEG
jgi:hypothetical protein